MAETKSTSEEEELVLWNPDGTRNDLNWLNYYRSLGLVSSVDKTPWNTFKGFKGDKQSPGQLYSFMADKAGNQYGNRLGDDFTDFYKQGFGNVYNRYMTSVERDAFGMPQTSFRNYLTEFPWQKYYKQYDTLTGKQRGINQQQYAPSVKWY